MKAELEKLIKPDSNFGDLCWREHLIKCPSQISFNFSYMGQNFEMYLRWRHQDPWTFSFISYSPLSEDSEWYDQENFPYFTHDEWKSAEEWCENWLVEQLNSKEFNKYLIEDGEIF